MRLAIVFPVSFLSSDPLHQDNTSSGENIHLAEVKTVHFYRRVDKIIVPSQSQIDISGYVVMSPGVPDSRGSNHLKNNNFFTRGKIGENALLFKALGDETRLKMIGLLKHGELCVCDLMEVLELPQSTASRHLAYLKNSGWVVGTRRGKWMYYKIHPDLPRSPVHGSIIDYVSRLDGLQAEKQKLHTYLKEKDTSVQCP